jgi:signal transduction histidine kinase
VQVATAGYSVVGLAALVYVASLLLRRRGEFLPAFDVDLKLPVEFAAALLCLVAGLRAATRRPGALMLGVALLVRAVGDLLFTVASPSGAPPPSCDDVLFLAFYPLAYVAVLVAVRADVRGIQGASWMDGLITALGCATIVTSLGVDEILTSDSASVAGFLVDLARPIGDLALLSLVVGVFGVIAHLDLRQHLPGVLVLGGCALFAVSDTFYLIRTANGIYVQGSPWDAGWTVAMVLMSVSTWGGRPELNHAYRPGKKHVVLPGTAALTGFGVLVYGTWHQLGAVDALLALATLATAFVRVLTLLRELDGLEAERRLRLQAEEAGRRLALQEAENRTLAIRLAGLVDASPVGIVEVDVVGNVQRWNRAAERIYGWSAAEVLGSPDPNPGMACGGPWQPVRHRRKDGGTVEVEVATAPLGRQDQPEGMLKVVNEVSERTRLELQLRHAQKLETVGRLAEGLAHELNTPIQFVGDGVRFLETAMSGMRRLQRTAAELETAQDPPTEQLERLRRVMDEIDLDFLADEGPAAADNALDGLHRMAEIVRAMGVFGRPGETLRRAIDLNEAVGAVLIMAGPRVSLVSDVTTDLGDLPLVMCHPGDINHVLFDVVANAADAMAAASDRRGRGHLHVVTRAEDDQVVVEVSDTGCGIPEAIAERVFDPFFTTKPVGQGMGQGLSVARSLIVSRHGGTITFTSQPERGTTFRITLPVD